MGGEKANKAPYNKATTTVRTTTTASAIGEIDQYTDCEEHFYFSEYYQDYQENNDNKFGDTEEMSWLSDYEYTNQGDLYNNAKPTKLDDRRNLLRNRFVIVQEYQEENH